MRPRGLAKRRRKKSNMDSRQTLSARFAWLIDSVSSPAGCAPGVVLKAGCRTAALRLPVCREQVSLPAQLDLLGPGCQAKPRAHSLLSSFLLLLLFSSPPPPSTCPPPTSLIMSGEKARKYPPPPPPPFSSSLQPPTPAAPRLQRVGWGGVVMGWGGGEKGKKKRRESGAKCERGLVSMPTAGGRTYAASQAAMVPARHLFLSLLFSSPRLPSPPVSAISRGDKAGPCASY